jgi:tetratricopeptide (TPR) repeat protein
MKIGKPVVFVLLAATVAVSYQYSGELYRFYIKTYYLDIKKETHGTSLENARGLYRDGKFEELSGYLEDLRTIYPDDKELRRLAGRTMIRHGDKSEGARLVLSTVTPRDDVRDLAGVVEILFEDGEYSDVASLLSRYDVSTDPYLSYVYGVSLYFTKKYSGAARALASAKRLGRKDYDTFHYSGLACQRLGDNSEAISNFEEAYRIDPVRREARESLIEMYRKTRQFEKAERLIRRGMR